MPGRINTARTGRAADELRELAGKCNCKTPARLRAIAHLLPGEWRRAGIAKAAR